MDEWKEFFLGEVGAAAALAGLLFVSVSVNQQHILALGRMADRGAEALIILILALIVASLPLIPGQSLQLLGAEILGVGLFALVATLLLQRSYLRDLEPTYRRQSTGMIWLNRVAVATIVLGGLLLLLRGDTAGLYVIALGILLIFCAAGAIDWVLLIEINR